MRSGVKKTERIQSGSDTPRNLVLFRKISLLDFREATVNFSKRVLEGSFFPSRIGFSMVNSKPGVLLRWYGPGQDHELSFLGHYCWWIQELYELLG